MKTKLKFLTKMSLKKKMMNKWFVTANIIIGLAIIAIANIDTIITTFGGDFDKPTKIVVIDNTNESYDLFESNFKEVNKYLEDMKPAKISLYKDTYKEALKEVEKENIILVKIDESDTNTLKATVIAKTGIDELIYQCITTSINSTKSLIAIKDSNISIEDITKIYSQAEITKKYLDESNTENNEMLMGAIFPILILPFFMLSIYLVQMIGAEINDEKTTRGMEIIIGNVSPKTHFYSKIIAGNAFVLIQGLLLITYSGIGLIIRNFSGAGSIIGSLGNQATDVWKTLVDAGFLDQLIVIVPITLVLMILSFIAYSLIAGILASMTTSIEDYQQIQVPIIMISLTGYYLSIMSTMFSGSLFIHLMSYVPFISALLAPALLILGEINVFDILISIVLLLGLNHLLIKYGLRIYKVGILNYSSNKLWTKIFKAIKNEDVV